MLLEGALAVIVILACCAGVGMGVTVDGITVQHKEAWLTKYDPSSGWATFGLIDKVGAFVDGGANFINALGIPLKMATGIIAVLVASFAATTLDTATRLQRYVIQELGATLKLKPLTNKYTATFVAVSLGAAMAMIPAPDKAMGTGGLILWPLFGATNQLLAGLAFMVLVFYLWRRKLNIWFAAIPMVMMLIMPAWALIWQLFNADSGWAHPLDDMLLGETSWAWHNNHLLLGIGLATLILQVWIVVEGVLLFPRSHGVLEEMLEPLDPGHS
jgi:carbon starvation protein